jgi:hypothetical protein
MDRSQMNSQIDELIVLMTKDRAYRQGLKLDDSQIVEALPLLAEAPTE